MRAVTDAPREAGLIGRSLRAGVDRVALGERQITIDCDVIQADGGTRCASITGGWIALRRAVNTLQKAGLVTSDPITDHVAVLLDETQRVVPADAEVAGLEDERDVGVVDHPLDLVGGFDK